MTGDPLPYAPVAPRTGCCSGQRTGEIPLPCAPVAPPFGMSGSPAARPAASAAHAQHLVQFAAIRAECTPHRIVDTEFCKSAVSAIRAEYTPHRARTRRFPCSNCPRRIHHHCGSRRARRQLTAPPCCGGFRVWPFRFSALSFGVKSAFRFGYGSAPLPLDDLTTIYLRNRPVFARIAGWLQNE